MIRLDVSSVVMYGSFVIGLFLGVSTRKYCFSPCFVFAELQKQNERLIGDLSKRDDSHTLLLQVKPNKTRANIIC
jgi:hypothetical protein